MEKLETLNRNYSLISQLQCKYVEAVVNYIDESLALLKGTACLNIKYKTYREAVEKGGDFFGQFSLGVSVEDWNDCMHYIYITKLTKDNDVFIVDGWDETSGKWTENWYMIGDNDTLAKIACFLNVVLNQKMEEEKKNGENTNLFVPELVGYQIVNEHNAFPWDFTCWDVFHTPEAAKAYIYKMDEPGEWKIVEEYTTSHTHKNMYNFVDID